MIGTLSERLPGDGGGQPTAVPRARFLLVGLVFLAMLGGIATRTVRLSITGQTETRLHSAEPIARTLARPEIVDRHGRIVATDIAAPSLYADPALILDLDEMVEKLAVTLPGLDEDDLRRQLSDRTRRFVWVRRGLTPIDAQRVHELGLPGLSFRRESKRVYPVGALAGHLVGFVNVDNRGQAGLERHIDETIGTDLVAAAAASRLGPVRLALDLGVQHAVSEELRFAMARYRAAGAAALVMDVASGEVVAAVSSPTGDPNRPAEMLDSARPDRLQAGVYELGSIFKLLTVAMAIEDGTATLDKTYSIAEPIEIGRYVIKDAHAQAEPITVRDIFLQSSNVGAGRIAMEAGTARQLMFLARMGLTEPIRTEAGPVAPPLLPQRWDRIETVTISYGHGLALAPVQFAAAAAALINGGRRVTPRLIALEAPPTGEQILAPATSDAIREVMRLNVTSPKGTGRRADVPGYRVGGKTGTAEIAGSSGYQRKAVIASFLGAFPMDAPRYLTLVTLFEPQPGEETRGQITAGVNAAPVTARIVTRIAPILGILPRRLEAAETPRN